MAVIVAGVPRFAVGSVSPMAMAARVYGAATQDCIVGVMVVVVGSHGLASQFGADQCAADRRQLATAALAEFSADQAANDGAGDHASQFGIGVVAAMNGHLPAVLPSSRRSNLSPVIVIVQRGSVGFVRPIAGTVVAAVRGDRSAGGSAHGEQDHDAGAGAEVHECLPICHETYVQTMPKT